ncbi:hypothetical protein T7987_15840 [Sulfitobacter faviae]|uniref:WGR domain-containing protein n=1 Tax=Sulfitobacter faviae TaxID=1775881 RepID=A0ABZ0UZR2_9RHOB|nr:hypothetical protein [Sulfitobacter faviae]WPZ21614.1 hypothetical protein T7987_15840 [Sulfitobacter faviae]
MKIENITRFQTVSIWVDRDGTHRVRGYYRACSYLLSTHDNLQEAFDAAQKVKRKQNSIAVVPFYTMGSA